MCFSSTRFIRLQPNIEEILYPAMEDFKLDIIIVRGQRPDAPSGSAPLHADRSDHPRRLDHGALRSASVWFTGWISTPSPSWNSSSAGPPKFLNAPITPEGCQEIATRCRGTPRVANRLLKRTRDYAQVKGTGEITAPIARDALRLLDIDEHGFDDIDRKLCGCHRKIRWRPRGRQHDRRCPERRSRCRRRHSNPIYFRSASFNALPRPRRNRLAYEHLGLRTVLLRPAFLNCSGGL